MNSIPLLKAKLIIPEIPEKVLASSRIKDLKITDHRAVLVTAPAGFGKTTAVLLSLYKQRNRIRWYRMEKEDSFLPVFYAHLIETLLGKKADGITDSARSLGSIGKISEEYPLLNAVICQDAWMQFPEGSDGIYIVFDDFHNVSDNTAIVETLRYFTVNLPPDIRIIVISRTDTGIKTGKLALNNDIAEIGEQELRFTKEEVHRLTSDIYKIPVKDADIDLMHQYSEGWIAVITMLIHTAGPTEPNIRRLITRGGDDKQNIFKYLLNEIFNGPEKNIAKDLVRISILPEFTCDDLETIFEMDNSSETIAWLEKSNLYIQKFKLKKNVYRFHSLFRNALLSVFNDIFTEKEINTMYLSAADYYKKLGDYQNATEFLLAADDVKEAVRIAVSEGIQYMDAGDTDRVASIIHAFPEELIQNNEYLLFMQGAALMNSEADQSSALLRRALSGFKRSGDITLQMKTVGLLTSIAAQKNEMKEIVGVISQLPKFKPVLTSKYARATLLMSAFMGAAWADNLRACDIMNKFIKRMNFYEPLWDYTNKMAELMITYRKGDFRTVPEKIEMILNHPTAMVNDRWRAIGLVVSSNATSLMGDVEASERFARDLASIGEKYDSYYSKGYALRVTAFNKYMNRDVRGAAALMDESAKLFSEYGNLIISHASKIMGYLYQAEYEAAGPLAKKANQELEELVALKPGQGQIELCQGITGTLYKESGDLESAEKLLSAAFKTSCGKKALQSICGSAMHLADLYHRKGDIKLEEKFLKLWGDISSANGYLYFREMNYFTLVRVCARCIQMNVGTDHMHRIICKYFGNDNADRLLKDPAQAVQNPGAFISDCLSSPAKVKTIGVKLFGAFRMTVDGMEITKTEWKTRKISGILKYLLANPDKTVSRETLSVIFWPESDAKDSSTSLRAALYELRKVLARFDMAFESEEALISEGVNGFQLCRRHMLECDTDKFTNLYKMYRHEKHSPETARPLLEQMTALYEGDFLENDNYDEWVDLSREHYKSIFIEVSHKLARIYMSAGEFELAEALLLKHMKIDPYDEKACGMLIYLNDNTGRKNQAVSLRRQFEKRFLAEIGTRPDLRYSSDSD